MATEIVKVQAEIIPRPNLVGVELAVAKLNLETDKLEPLKERADEILAVSAIAGTPEQCRVAKALQLEIKTVGKAAGLMLDPYWQVVKAAQDALSQIYANHEDKAKAIDDELKAWVKTFETEEKRKAQVEQDRINTENARLAGEKADADAKTAKEAAEVKRKAEVAVINRAMKDGAIGKREGARLLKLAGDIATAAKLNAEIDAEEAKNAPPPQVTVKPNIPTQAGVPSRTNYKAELKDPNAIIEAYIRTFAKPVNMARRVYLRQFITIDEQKIGEEARHVKDSKLMATMIPGVRFYED